MLLFALTMLTIAQQFGPTFILYVHLLGEDDDCCESNIQFTTHCLFFIVNL